MFTFCKTRMTPEMVRLKPSGLRQCPLWLCSPIRRIRANLNGWKTQIKWVKDASPRASACVPVTFSILSLFPRETLMFWECWSQTTKHKPTTGDSVKSLFASAGTKEELTTAKPQTVPAQVKITCCWKLRYEATLLILGELTKQAG